MIRGYVVVLQYLAGLLIAAILMNVFAIYRARSEDRSHCPPRAFCGCCLANHLGIHDKKQWRMLWVARNWANVGRPAMPGCIGCVVVLSRGRGGHVGLSVGYVNGDPVVWSCNHGGVAGAGVYNQHRVIAYRSL